MLLYHYYEQAIGPFKSISDLSDSEAENILQQIRLEKPDIFLSKPVPSLKNGTGTQRGSQ